MISELTLPWPPTVNGYRIPVQMGKRCQLVSTNEGKKYVKRVGEALITQKYQSFVTNVEVMIELYPPDKRQRDIDNYNKALLDALVKNHVLSDDSLIKKLTIEMKEKVRGGEVKLTISEV